MGGYHAAFGWTAAFLVLSGATAARAQEQSFDQLPSRLAVGDKVIVTDVKGREMHGRIAQLSPTSLDLMLDRNRVQLARDDIQRVSRRDSRWNGTLWGAAAGGLLGALFEKSLAKEYGRDDVGAGTVTVPFAAIGAGIGFAVDALVKGERVLYSKPRTSTVRLSVSPIRGDARKGVTLSIRF